MLAIQLLLLFNNNILYKCEIFHTKVHEDARLLAYDSISTGERLRTFRKSLLQLSSVSQQPKKMPKSRRWVQRNLETSVTMYQSTRRRILRLILHL
jgi:hypothetical protein